ncbi:MAG TPA: hypothetical protein VGC77_19035 [Rhodopseudomonas sp.]|uniref:hypothetical protein n=1 Tax=Rhodopseudomonas sp. TaxID=1078 RepID=UPI002EDB2540
MLLTRSTDPMVSETPKGPAGADCSACNAALSYRCIGCERADRARLAAADPMTSRQFKGWIGSALYPPK